MSCKNCDRFLKSSSIAVSGTNLLITVESNVDLENMKRFCLLLAQPIPTGSNTNQVYLSVNGTNYPVFTRSGNYLRADQIRCRKLYPVVYGNDPVHFSLIHCVPNTAYSVATTPTVS